MRIIGRTPPALLRIAVTAIVLEVVLAVLWLQDEDRRKRFLAGR